MKARSTFWVLLLAILVVPTRAGATGLQPETSSEVRVESMRYDVVVRGRYVAGTMEARFWAAVGDNHRASLRFPLPAGAVLHRAEIYLPDQDRWEVAETMGRREGQTAFEVAEVTGENRLLVQRIGIGLYRARVFPIDNDARLILRVSYAHTLERQGADDILRIKQASADAHSTVPNHGLTVRVDVGANAWTSGAFDHTPGSTSASFSPQTGLGEVRVDMEPLDRDIILRLSPARTERVAALRYTPSLASLPNHTAVWWRPDLTAHPTTAAQARNVVFVLDRSGSMGTDKMELAKTAVIHALGELDGDDRFGVVAFDSNTRAFEEQMAPAERSDAAAEWVSAIASGSSTGMASALERAATIGLTSPHSDRPVDILLITDGHPTDGPGTAQGMVDFVRLGLPEGRDVRIFGCGIGYDLDQSLINGMSALTGGESTFALADAAITGQIIDLFSRVRDGGVYDVDLTVGSTDIALPEPSFTGISETSPRPRLFLDNFVRLGTTLAQPTFARLDGFDLNGAPIVVEAPLATRQGTEAAFQRIAAPLAAQAWAEAIERRVDLNGETDADIDAAVVLAKTYGIVTRYSSMIALDTPQAYADLGVARVERDEAGIAVEPVSTSAEEEDRIGGNGAAGSPSEGEGEGEGEYASPSSEDARDAAGGCGCELPGWSSSPFDRDRSVGLLLIALGFVVVRRSLIRD